MAKRSNKFDRTVAYRMVHEEKKTITEVARIFGVNKGSVSRALKELRPAIASQVALEAGHKIVTTQLDAVGQLRKINSDANEILELMMRWQRGDQQAIQILEQNIRTVKYGKGETAKEVQMFKIKDPREIALKAMGEIREQLALQVEIMKTLHDVNAIAEFQKHVLETIGTANKCVSCGKELDIVCPDCGTKFDPRAVIILKLKEARALRQGVKFSP